MFDSVLLKNEEAPAVLTTANMSTVEDEELCRRAKLYVYQLINIRDLTYANKLWVRLEIQGGKLKFLRLVLTDRVSSQWSSQFFRGQLRGICS